DFSVPGVTIWDYGLPFTRRTSTAITDVCGTDLYLSSEQLDGSIADISATPVVGAAGVTKARTRCVRYEHDSFHAMMVTNKDGHYRSLNRHLASERAVDHDSGGPTIREVHRFDLDGFGHYRVTVTDGNLAAGNQKKTVRHHVHDIGLGTGLQPSTYKIKDGNLLASSPADDADTYPGIPGIESPRHSFLFDTTAHIHPWLLGLYDAVEVWEDNGDGTWEDHEVTRTELCL
ncbi:MAG: hypothetical protein GY856_35025, partial [bacterium]|nr:hypothetical protein [bacterium]